jgi:DNA-binding NarL/FixJ family response regulator
MAISLVLADASPLSCQLLSRGLTGCNGKFRVLATAVDSAGAVEQITQHRPDVALIGAALQDGPRAGFKVLREVFASGASTLVVLLLDRPDQEAALRAFASGAKGVLFSTEAFDAVCKCIRCVHAGQVWANTDQMHSILEALAEREPLSVVDAKGKPLLTKREEEIVRLVAEGLTNSQISAALHLSAHTVKNHLFHIYEKVGISNRVELILYALSCNRRAPNAPELAA